MRLPAVGATAARRQALDIGVYGARGIPSTYSGYETFLTVLLPELVKRGHRVTIYCRTGQVADHAPYEGVHRVVLPALSSYRLETVSHGVVAASAARRRRHQVVLVVNVANAPVCLLARATGQRIVLNTDGQEWLRGKWGAPARSYWRVCARLSRSSASALVSDSVAMRDVYASDFGAPSTVIPYCWTGLEPAGEAAGFLERFSLEPYRYFLVAARLNPENSVAEMASAYVSSGADDPLVVLGAANYDSPVQRELDRLSRRCPNLRVAGHVDDRSAFATLVARSTAYLHGHRVGGINPSLLEAMGCGANIMALDTPFNREALGGAGSYFSDFAQELPEKIRAAEAEAAPAGAGRRDAARRRCHERFGAHAVVDAYEALFSEVVRRSPWATTTLPTRW